MKDGISLELQVKKYKSIFTLCQFETYLQRHSQFCICSVKVGIRSVSVCVNFVLFSNITFIHYDCN